MNKERYKVFIEIVAVVITTSALFISIILISANTFRHINYQNIKLCSQQKYISFEVCLKHIGYIHE